MMLVPLIFVISGAVCSECKHSGPDVEIFNDCASCLPEPTCQVPIPTPRACPKVCVQRYECDRSKGYIRDESTGTCVLERNCPVDTPCGPNQFFNICASNCIAEPTCQNPDPKISGACAQVCVQRCDCDIYNGYIRDEVTGLCIRKESCTVVLYSETTVFNESRPVCTNQEVYNTCASLCIPEPTCQNPNPQQHGLCPLVCLGRCECDSSCGLIRDELTGECVTREKCLTCDSTSQRPGCLSCCNNADIPTCRNPTPNLACDCFTCNPGCVCAEGFVLNEYTGECIHSCNCPV